jgi:predicted metal-dependent hydrolase
MNCKIIRSNRKSLGLEVNTEGLIIRAPLQATDAEINMFILQHKGWIEKNLEKVAERQKTIDQLEPLSMDEIRALADKALKIIPERVKFYAPKVGVNYGRITIRNQRSKWGSCSS